MTERTEQQQPRSSERGPGGVPALIVAHPTSLALPIPAGDGKVGRDWLAAAGIVDTKVSGAHLRFSRPGGTLHVEDVGSTNGTWLNGTPLPRGKSFSVNDGALLRVGTTLLVYRKSLLAGPHAAADPLCPAPPLSGLLVGPYGLRALAQQLASLRRWPPRCVLIRGDTGAGKEHLATAVQRELLPAASAPPFTVNVAATPANLVASALFGHVRGAFSEAFRDEPGYIRRAKRLGCAIFLDEIGELRFEQQATLLRFLDYQVIQPVGGEPTQVDGVPVIAATNRDIEKMTVGDGVQSPSFRLDLYHRLSKEVLWLPRLDDRAEDLYAIAGALLARRAPPNLMPRFEVEAVERLMLHDWPGNVRELDAILERAVRMSPAGQIALWVIERLLGEIPPSNRPSPLTDETVWTAATACEGNQTRMAARLGISHGKLQRYLAQTPELRARLRAHWSR